MISKRAGIYVTLRPQEIGVEGDDEGVWPSPSGVRRIVMVLAFCAGFVVAMNYVGVIPTSLVFLFVMALSFGGSLLQALLTSTLLSAALWFVFIYLLQVRLPTGSLVSSLFGS